MPNIRLLIDEDVPKGPQLAAALRRRGFDAVAVQEIGKMHVSDEELLNYAAVEGRALLSCNIKDFVQIAVDWYESGKEHAGIVVSEQFSSKQFGEILRRVLNLLNSVDAEEIRNTVRFLQEFRWRGY